MNISLDSSAKKLITKWVKSGKYATPEEVVAAALRALEEERTGEFAGGEWDTLLAEGEAGGKALDGIPVLNELRALRTRRSSSKAR